MRVKLPFRYLNPSPHPLYLTNTYICKVTITLILVKPNKLETKYNRFLIFFQFRKTFSANK